MTLTELLNNHLGGNYILKAKDSPLILEAGKSEVFPFNETLIYPATDSRGIETYPIDFYCEPDLEIVVWHTPATARNKRQHEIVIGFQQFQANFENMMEPYGYYINNPANRVAVTLAPILGRASVVKIAGYRPTITAPGSLPEVEIAPGMILV